MQPDSFKKLILKTIKHLRSNSLRKQMENYKHLQYGNEKQAVRILKKCSTEKIEDLVQQRVHTYNK